MKEFNELPASKKSLAKRKPVFGVGINDSDYITQPTINGKELVCQYYRTWKHMLQRCYSPKYQLKKPTYLNCTVCPEWLLFSNFKSWMIKQDWQDKCLDKDILLQGNKVYSPDTCMFVTNAINTLLCDAKTIRGNCAIGVTWSKDRSKYAAQCSVDGKNKHLGFYLTEEEASQVYRVFKRELILVIANRQTNIKLKDALLRIAGRL